MVTPKKRKGGALTKALAKARFPCPEYLSEEAKGHWLTACDMAPSGAGVDVIPHLVGIALSLVAVSGYDGPVPEGVKPNVWHKGRQDAVSMYLRATADLKRTAAGDGAVSAATAIFDRMERVLAA